MKRKLLSVLLCTGMLLSALTGCGGKTEIPAEESIEGPAEEAEEGTAAGKTNLRVAVNLDAPGFCPYTSGYNVASALIIRNVYETLINMDNNGNLYPGLATEWEWGENDMSVILTLREGVKFSNGEDFNADTAIFSLRDYRGKTAVGGESETLYDFDNMVKLENYKIEIPLKRPGSDALINLTDMIYCICSKKAAEELGDAYPTTPVGTGPYKFVSFTSGVGAKMEANEEYWGGVPVIKEVETVLIAEASQAQIELESGNIDLIAYPDSMDVKRIMNQEVKGFKVMELPSGNVKNLWFNFRKDTIKDDNLRKAISCAIDKQAIIDVAFGGFATVANQKIANNNGAYDVSYDENPMYPYDIEKAKEYLAASNYPDGLTLTMYSEANQVEQRFMECIKNDLAQIGIELEIFGLDANVAVPTLIEGVEDDLYGTIGCSAAGYAPGYLKNASPGMTPNWGKWDEMECDVEINNLYEQALAATDVDECNELVRQAIRLEMENAMAVPICYPLSYMTCSDKLQNIIVDGSSATYHLQEAYFTE